MVRTPETKHYDIKNVGAYKTKKGEITLVTMFKIGVITA